MTGSAIYGNGPIVADAEVVAVYCGDDWAANLHLLDVRCRLYGFFSTAVAGALVASLGEYDVGGHHIGSGTFVGDFVRPFSPAQPTQIPDQAIRDLLETSFEQNQLPDPTVSRVYCVILAPGLSVIPPEAFRAGPGDHYHATFRRPTDGTPVFYCVVGYEPSGFDYEWSMLVSDVDRLTIAVSHELIETITDPVPDTGWTFHYDDTPPSLVFGLATPCEGGRPSTLQGFLVSAYWSQQRQACFVPTGGSLSARPGSVTISVVGNQCSPFLVKGTRARLRANVTGTVAASYDWTVAGAITLGPGGNREVDIDVPDTATLVVAMVVARDDHGCTYSHSRTFADGVDLLSRAQGALSFAVCEFLQYLDRMRPNMPPWPEPSLPPIVFPAQAGLDRSIVQMRDAARRMATAAERLVEEHGEGR